MDIQIERTLAAVNAAIAGRPLFVVRVRGEFAGNKVDVRMEFRTKTARDKQAAQWRESLKVEVQSRDFSATELRAALK